MRLLALGAALVVAYAWGRAREYRAWLDVPLPEYDVQPPDPVTVRPVVVTLPNTLSTTEVGHIRGWLTDHPDVLAELYESHAIRRSAQSSEVTTEGMS